MTPTPTSDDLRARLLAAEIVRAFEIKLRVWADTMPDSAASDFMATITWANAALSAPLAGGEPVAWCALKGDGSIAYFDGKPMVMPGKVGNEHHPVPLYTPPPPDADVGAQGEECPACHRAWTEHRSGYSASQCRMKPTAPAAGKGVDTLPAKWRERAEREDEEGERYETEGSATRLRLCADELEAALTRQQGRGMERTMTVLGGTLNRENNHAPDSCQNS